MKLKFCSQSLINMKKHLKQAECEAFCHSDIMNTQSVISVIVFYLDLYVSGVVNVLLNEQPVVSKAGCGLLR